MKLSGRERRLVVLLVVVLLGTVGFRFFAGGAGDEDLDAGIVVPSVSVSVSASPSAGPGGFDVPGDARDPFSAG